MTTDSIPNEPRRRLWRSRWAAIGAAIAVTFGGGGLFAAIAASPESTVVTIEPVRILDTRDTVDVGLPGPFVSPAAQDLKVTGSVPTTTGIKTVVPPGATGVFLNVTPVGSTAAGFISVRPATATGPPSTSNVNFEVGAINPNAVLVELPVGGADDGTIEITFDAFGATGPTTDILVDVVGYTLKEVRSAAVTAQDLFERVEAVDEVVVSLPVTAPVAGQVTVFSTTAVGDDVANGTTSCYITTGTVRETGFLQRWNSPGKIGRHAQLSGVRTFDIAAGATVVYNLVCHHSDTGFSNLESTVISAIFTPAVPTP
jgi:hypothetical protein